MNSDPQICFGTVHHERLRPVKNAFQYGVYFIRLPLRTMAGSDFSSKLFSRNRFNLLSFHDADHGDGVQPLTNWIESVLQHEGIKDADGEVWLQAFPRVLGYVFNPVSFWFCHRADGALRAVLCEVRNTFGERHCYLLDTGAAIVNGAELSAKKIFHVSPFCAVEGNYRFRFLRSAAANAFEQERHTACINHDDEIAPLLRTSISGVARVVSDRVVAKAFFTYPLMTFSVIGRIHWQALRLWIKRVPFFRKPSPPSNQMSR